MEGASAAITFVQLGLSIATTLNTYIADVRHGRDDVANLANEIEATVSHAQDLDKLIRENKLTSRWSGHGLFLAEKCLTDCHDVIKRLSALLRRSGGTAPGKQVLNGAEDVESNDTKSLISRTDIDMSNFNRLYWPLLKPQLQYLKQELQKIKLDILLAVNTYRVNATPKADDRKAIAEQIVALWRSRTVARRQLVVYRGKLEKYGQWTRVPVEVPDVDERERTREIPDLYESPEERPHGKERDVSPASTVSSARSYRRHRRPTYQYNQNAPPIIVEKKSQDSLLCPSPQAGPPFAPDPEYVGEKSKGRQIIDYALGFILGPGEDATGTKQSLTQLWDSYKNNPAALKSVLNKIITAVPAKPTKEIPLALKDPHSPNGVAFTHSLLICDRSPGYSVQPINYPPELLSKRLFREERKARKTGSLNLQAYNTLSALPEIHQRMITKWLHPVPYAPYHWELLILDPTYGPPQGDNSRRKRLTQKFRRGTAKQSDQAELTSILAVFKRCMKPDNGTSSSRSRSRSSDSDDDDRQARRRRTIRNIAIAVVGALAAAGGEKDKPSAPRNREPSIPRPPRGRPRRRRDVSPRPVRRDDNQWRPAPERGTGRVYQFYETEEPPDNADGRDEDLAEKIVAEYTGPARPNGSTDVARPNGVGAKVSDTLAANDNTFIGSSEEEI